MFGDFLLASFGSEVFVVAAMMLRFLHMAHNEVGGYLALLM